MTSPNKKPLRPSTIAYISPALALAPYVLPTFAEATQDTLRVALLFAAAVTSCLGIALAVGQALKKWLSGTSGDSDSRMETICLAHHCSRHFATTSCVLSGHPVRMQAIRH